MYLTDVMEEKAKSKDDRMDKDVNVVHFFFYLCTIKNRIGIYYYNAESYEFLYLS